MLPERRKSADHAGDYSSDLADVGFAHDEESLEHGIPLKLYTPTPVVLPEEGQRIPDLKYPETPPDSKSRRYSPWSRTADADGYDTDVLQPPFLAGYLSSINITHAPSLSTSVENNRRGIGRESREARPGSGFQCESRGRGLGDPRDRSHSGIAASAWEHGAPPLHLLFLGSSLGNFDRSDSVHFLRSLPLRPGSSDTLLLGLDGRNEKTLVEKAYNDPDGYTAKFILNGLNVTARTLGLNGHEANLIEKFQYVGTYNEEIGERPVKHPFLTPPMAAS